MSRPRTRTQAPDPAPLASSLHARRLSLLTWAIVALGIAFRLFHYLRDPSIWHDEAALVLNVLNKGFAELTGPLLFAEAAPPLFLWLERAVVIVLGDSTFALRLASVVGSCTALVLMVPLARRVLQARAVPWAVLLLAGSDRLLWHACEAKPYSLDVLMAVALPCLFCVTRPWPPVRRLVLFTLLAPITIFLVYPGCFLYGGLLVALLGDNFRHGRGDPATWQWRRRLAYGFLALTVFVSFAFLLSGPIRAQRCPTLNECWALTFPNWRHPWTVPGWSVWSTVRVADYCCRPVGGVLVLVAALGTISLWRRRRRSALLLLLLPPLLAFVAACFKAYPYTGARVMVYAAPAVCLLVGEGVPPLLRWLRRQAGTRVRRISVRVSLRSMLFGSPHARLAAGLTLALYALLLAPLARTVYRVAVPWERPDAAGASAYVLSHRQPNDAVVACCWEHLYYFRHLGAALVTPGTAPGQPTSRLWVVVTAKMSSEDRLQIAHVLSRGDHQTLHQREFTDTTVLLTERNPAEAEDGTQREPSTGLDYWDGDVDPFPSFFDALRAMRAATYPPLKPLSIFTTTTFAEQLLSMVNKGATPENAAP